MISTRKASILCCKSNIYAKESSQSQTFKMLKVLLQAGQIYFSTDTRTSKFATSRNIICHKFKTAHYKTKPFASFAVYSEIQELN